MVDSDDQSIADHLTEEQYARIDAMSWLFQKWSAVDRSYDIRAWAELERSLDRYPVAIRPYHTQTLGSDSS